MNNRNFRNRKKSRELMKNANHSTPFQTPSQVDLCPTDAYHSRLPCPFTFAMPWCLYFARENRWASGRLARRLRGISRRSETNGTDAAGQPGAGCGLHFPSSPRPSTTAICASLADAAAVGDLCFLVERPPRRYAFP